MVTYISHFLERAYSLAGFLFALSAMTLFMGAIPVLLLSLFWMQ
ncbi:MAG: hypothetical protein ACKVJG_16525 [Candidatus Latescibacterota bacterium]